MIARTSLILTIVLLINGCSLWPVKPIQIESQPVELEIIQPSLPRPIQLGVPEYFVVSEAIIANPCKYSIPFDPPRYDDDGKERLKRPKTCSLEERENPDWPVGYTYLDKFLDDIKKANAGDVVFVASTIADYELMSTNVQELRRYIRELGEVIVYYREVTDVSD